MSYHDERVVKRFTSKIVPIDSGCHIWHTCQDNHDKRGAINIGGVSVPAYRVALEIRLGRALLPGMQANHTCDVGACVNADHLYEGTQKENIADSIRRGRFVPPPPPNPAFPPPVRYGAANNRAVLTEAQVLEMRSLYPGVSYTDLAAAFGISKSTVDQVIKRRTWRNVG